MLVIQRQGKSKETDSSKVRTIEANSRLSSIHQMGGPGMGEELKRLLPLRPETIYIFFNPIVVFSQTPTWLHSFLNLIDYDHKIKPVNSIHKFGAQLADFLYHHRQLIKHIYHAKKNQQG